MGVVGSVMRCGGPGAAAAAAAFPGEAELAVTEAGTAAALLHWLLTTGPDWTDFQSLTALAYIQRLLLFPPRPSFPCTPPYIPTSRMRPEAQGGGQPCP